MGLPEDTPSNKRLGTVPLRGMGLLEDTPHRVKIPLEVDTPSNKRLRRMRGATTIRIRTTVPVLLQVR